LLLGFALRRSWWPISGLSAALWTLAQFGAGRALYQAIADAIGLDLPVTETGAFSLLAWQFLWVGGLWMGSLKAPEATQGLAAPQWAIAPAIAIAAVCLAWRHVAGQVPVPFPHETGHAINMLFDKWELGPLRLVNFSPCWCWFCASDRGWRATCRCNSSPGWARHHCRSFVRTW
jgi:hypothetical protein